LEATLDVLEVRSTEELANEGYRRIVARHTRVHGEPREGELEIEEWEVDQPIVYPEEEAHHE